MVAPIRRWGMQRSEAKKQHGRGLGGPYMAFVETTLAPCAEDKLGGVGARQDAVLAQFFEGVGRR